MNAFESSAVSVETPSGKGRHAERKPPMANKGSSLKTGQYLSE